MRRIAACLAWVGWAAVAGVAFAQDAPPPLTPAVVGPVADPVVEPAPAAPAGTPATAPAPTSAPAPAPAPRQVLVVPGVTRPRTGAKPNRGVRDPTPAAAPAPALAAGETDPFGSLPSLLDPDDGNAARRGAARPSFLGAAPISPGGTGRPPLTLESSPAAGDNDPSALTPPIEAPTRRQGGPAAPAAAPRRPFGLFGRYLPPLGPLDRRGVGNPGVKVDPPTDPAADAALKRRIERQVRDQFGPRLRSYEVRVVGGEVAIHARVARFWLRRSVQNGLQSLPELRGYKASVEVVD